MGKRGQAAKKRNMLLPKPALDSPDADHYQGRRLARVRKQLNMVDDAIDSALVPGGDLTNLKALVDASWRLCEQEFALSGRPKPGLLKPQAQAQRRPARPEPTPSKPACGPLPTTGSVQTQASEPGTPQSAQG